MKRQTRFALIAAALFAVLIGIKQWRATEPFEV